jgi:hypothetical protein
MIDRPNFADALTRACVYDLRGGRARPKVAVALPPQGGRAASADVTIAHSLAPWS